MDPSAFSAASAVKVFSLLLLHVAARSLATLERGQQVFALAGGCGCHNSADGPVGAGGREIKTPFGTFYATNITPDRETGIGALERRGDHRRDPRRR